MTRTTRSVLPALVALFALAGTARADQLQWLPKREADEAKAALAPGSIFVDWISHLQGKPVIYKVVSSEVVAVDSPGMAEVKVKAVKVAAAKTSRQPTDGPWQFSTIEGGQPEDVIIDLAYVYVPSTELPGSFVNLGKKQKLECSVRTVALEVGEATVAAIGRIRVSGLIGPITR